MKKSNIMDETEIKTSFEAMDTNKDGFITYEELTEFFKDNAMSGIIMMTLADKNLDRRLSYEEYKDYMLKKDS